MPEYSFLTKEDVINLVPFFHKLFTFMFFHKLLQSIVRSKSYRGKLFNFKILIRQFSFKRSLSKLRKIKLIRFSSNLVKIFSFLQSMIAPQVFKNGLPKIIGQVLLTAEPSTRKLAGYLVLPHKTSTSLAIPRGKIVSLLAS